eukprot:symbB.v1.2.024163.t1/scaffold2264.1/size174359/18
MALTLSPSLRPCQLHVLVPSANAEATPHHRDLARRLTPALAGALLARFSFGGRTRSVRSRCRLRDWDEVREDFPALQQEVRLAVVH